MSEHTVLIVEDDETLLRGLADNFRKRGFRVEVARSGTEGVANALNSPPDLIVLDIMLPNMNGFEVCRELRQRDVRSTIIILTARGQEEDVVRGLELGADDYVTKPFSIRELLARAHAFLRRRSQPARTCYEFGEFRLDLVAHQLFRQQQAVELTTKEFRLLEYFVQQAGRALTRRDILDQVWGQRVVVTTRSVDRCVTTLRAKIESNPQQPVFIQTIRDVGYRFTLD